MSEPRVGRLTARRVLRLVSLAALALSALQGTQGGEKPADGRRGGRGRRDSVALPAEVAALQPLSIVLGRPTEKSITVSVLSSEAQEGYIEYGTAAGQYSDKTAVTRFPAAVPVDVEIGGLRGNTRYHYRLQRRKPGGEAFTACPEHSFHTRRAPGSTFTFEIQGDSHPERPQMFDAALYALTLRAAAADAPDFYMTIGDDFSVDTLRTVNAETVGAVYLNQRLFLGLAAHSVPLFLVNGNHEQAARYNLDGTPSNVAVWAQTSRNRYFPQPAPDGFYTGNEQKVEHIGLLRDYYAWTWGDALFVAIDPYWHSESPVDNVFGAEEKHQGKRGRDLWAVTLGEEQYKWLTKTLQSSKARYKFVFTHHVLGTGRGGIEEAGLFEWGGKSKRGEDEFRQKRPGWELPIHPLMARNGVTIFFQGHDHVFARQQLDGVVYQSLPLPADPNYEFYNKDAYRSGDILPGTGRVRVSVSPEKVRVEYVRSRLPKDATAEHPDGEVAFTYDITAPQQAAQKASAPGTAKQSDAEKRVP